MSLVVVVVTMNIHNSWCSRTIQWVQLGFFDAVNGNNILIEIIVGMLLLYSGIILLLMMSARFRHGPIVVAQTMEGGAAIR